MKVVVPILAWYFCVNCKFEIGVLYTFDKISSSRERNRLLLLHSPLGLILWEVSIHNVQCIFFIFYLDQSKEHEQDKQSHVFTSYKDTREGSPILCRKSPTFFALTTTDFSESKVVRIDSVYSTTFVSTITLPQHPNIAAGDHKAYVEYAFEQDRLSPPAPTKFCGGTVLVDGDKNEIISAGYSMELPGNRPGDPGNTHAEHCCLIKIAEKYNVSEESLGEVLPGNTVLYTTMEPCNEKLSGNRTCVERILKLSGAVKVVYVHPEC